MERTDFLALGFLSLAGPSGPPSTGHWNYTDQLTTATLPLSSLQGTPLCCKLQWATFLDPELVSGHVQNPSFDKDVFKMWAGR